MLTTTIGYSASTSVRLNHLLTSIFGFNSFFSRRLCQICRFVNSHDTEYCTSNKADYFNNNISKMA